MVVAAVAAVGLIGSLLLGRWSDDDLERTSWVSGVLSLLVALAALTLAWPRDLFRRQVSSPEQLDLAARQLADLGTARWRRELDVRRVPDPEPIVLRWREEPDGTVVTVDPGATANRLGRLVVLGPAGAGKSVVLTLVTVELLARRAPTGPVPVLIPLAGWRPREEPLPRFVARRLGEDFPALGDADRYGATAVTDLVAQGRVLPLLDGLDEVAGDALPEAIAEINRGYPAGEPLVVSCRAEEYRAAVADALPVRGAEVRRLTGVPPGSAAEHLRIAAPAAHAARWAAVLDELGSEPDGVLAGALATPLMLSLARDTYVTGRRDPGELTDRRRLPSAAAVRRHLLTGFTPAVLEANRRRDGRTWEPESALRWLGFLARHLDTLRTPGYGWWRLADTVGRGPLAVLTAALVLLVLGVPTIGGTWLNFDQAGSRFGSREEALPWVAGADAVFAVVAGMITWLRTGPHLPARIRFTGLGRLLARWAGRGARLGFVVSLPLFVVMGCFLVERLPGDLVIAVLTGVTVAAVMGAPVGALVGAACWAVAATRRPVATIHEVDPAELLQDDQVATLVSSLAVAVLIWPVTAAAFGEYGLALTPYLVVLVMLTAGAHGRYRVAHVWLASRGCLPWRLMTFLADAHEYGVLRRSGAVYEFRHLELTEVLARPARG